MSAHREQHAVTLARRLDLREREILRALFEYEVLLTYQLRVLFFSSLRRCQDVLKKLKDSILPRRAPRPNSNLPKRISRVGRRS